MLVPDVGLLCKNLANRIEKWEDVILRYPAFEAKKEEK